jgi:hypothetical protein
MKPQNKIESIIANVALLSKAMTQKQQMSIY